MILLSTSNSVRKAFHVAPIETTPPVPSSEWHRFWHTDAKKIIGFGEVMLFTNHETLYTFVADSQDFKRANDFVMYFLLRYGEKFNGYFGYNGRIKEDIVIQRARDRSVSGIMNNHFLKIREFRGNRNHAEMETWLNSMPNVSREIFPEDYFNQKLKHRA